MTQKNTRRMTTRGNSASFNTKENSNNKEVYTNGSKSTGTKRGVLPEEASIHTVEMRAIRTMIDTKKGG